MSQNVEKYITEISDKYKTGRAGEHAYRPTFEKFIKSINSKLAVINDPKRTEYGAPDFIFAKGELITGYTETKDINADLNKIEKSEQVERYLGYSNLILTNYLEFRFFRNGERYGEPIIIGKIVGKSIIPEQESFNLLENTLADFLTAEPETIKNGVRLAKIMGGKARRIRDNVKQFLEHELGGSKELSHVYETVKKFLVHDLTPESFADMYAQTLVYGLFVARYYDETLSTFSRQEARELIPKSNPFLRHFFDHIVGPDFDKRLEYIVNELCEVFSHANVQELMKEYFKNDLWGKTHEGPDPVIHFYEDFLKEYDADLRKKLGAFYTPSPVVHFIVRSVDDILKKDFDLPQGLADTQKIGKSHRVQILDPAVGTGTFISAIIRIIYEKLLKRGQKGSWPAYVHHDLLPRLHGFELMMAPYTIAHLKLGMAFEKTGFKYFNQRLGIYLTNSLEEGGLQKGLFTGFGFAESIAEESKEAENIKNKTPIMVVVGNPPYSVSSSNKGEWIQDLIKDYKKDLGERKINLDDDYIKFIRFAEYFIEKNKSGIVAMITNNSFIDGITHRQMRKHLLETFDNIYILDLHGNSKKKEKAPDGGKDENVFDIMQGVSINIFIRKNEKKEKLGAVYHAELFGKRETKFEVLNKSEIKNIKWQKLDYSEPYYFFVPKDFGLEEEYKKGFKIDELFPLSNSGVKTDRDELFIDIKSNDLKLRTEKLLSGDYDTGFRETYRVTNSSGYKFTEKLKGKNFESENIQEIQYRPFDYRWIYYDANIISRPGFNIFKHTFAKNNILLCTSRSIPANQDFDRVLVSREIVDIHSASDQTYAFPLYLYPEKGESLRVGQIPVSRTPNLNLSIARNIANAIKAVYYPVIEYTTKESDKRLTPEDIFDYIYAILHSPNYREKYKEFLKIDFPRIPYPKNAEVFKKLVVLGRELRELHLLESSKVNDFITTYPVVGSNVVEKIFCKDRKVFINAEQYFGNVPEMAWNFYIGGYQPAQKWLKDRKGRTLTNEDIEYYQKIIVALTETDKIMKEIDKIISL